MASTSIRVINNTQVDIGEVTMCVSVGVTLPIPVWTERDIKRGETRVFPCEWVWYGFRVQIKADERHASVYPQHSFEAAMAVYGDSTVTLTDAVLSGTMAGSVLATQARTQPAPTTSSTLHMDQALLAGQALQSHDGRIKLIYQTDGNLVLLRGDSTVLWHAGTHGTAPGKVVMQTDGNVVVYDASGKAVWASSFHGGSWGPGPEFRDSRLVCQHDGNLVAYAKDDAVLWQTNTRG